MTDLHALFAKLSPAERRAFLAQAKGQASQLSDPDYRAKCRKLKAQFEKVCEKEKATLVDVFTLPSEDKTYKNPDTGAEWHNWQKGKKPAWVKEQTLAS
jgi:hypothetical protein